MPKLISVGGYPFKLIGDPHIGRVFKTGVPLIRLGDREKMVQDQLASELLSNDNTPIIIMGDLFDKYSIPDFLVLWLSEVLNEAASFKRVYILRGNHCVSREANKRGSFDVLEKLCPEVVFVNTYKLINLPEHAGSLILFGYDAFKSAKELAEEIPDNLNYLAAFGHWDLTAHGEDTHNLIPVGVLAAKGIKTAYTGHIHKPQQLKIQGVEVIVVGSLQPYAHGEELPDETLYQTLHKEEVEELLEENDNHFADVNLRVLVTPESSWTAEVPNCLSFQVKLLAANADADDLSDLEVGYEEFSTTNIVNKNLAGVSENLTVHIHERLDHYRNLEN